MRQYLLTMLVSLSFFASPVYSENKELNIVFIPKSSDQAFWAFMRDGVEKGMREMGKVKLTWRGPAYNDNTESQIKILEIYTTPDVDAIIIAPTDRVRLAEPVRKAAAMGIKVIVVDSALDGKHHLNFITTDNYAGGKLAAEHMSSLLHGQGNVIVLRTVAGSASTDDRARGFIDYIKKNSPRITIVADEYGGGSKGKASRSGVDLLRKFPQTDGIFAVNESSSDGMLRALRNAGMAGKIKLLGFDSSDFLLDGLEKKQISGLIIQNPRQMGYLGLKAAVAAARGASIKNATVLTDAMMVTLENYRKPEIQTLLFP